MRQKPRESTVSEGWARLEMIEVRQRVGLPWQSGETETTADEGDTVRRRSAAT